MQARGFAVDSAASDSGRTVVLASPKEKYRVLVAFHDQQLQAIQENYSLSTNDSTRRMWQQTCATDWRRNSAPGPTAPC